MNEVGNQSRFKLGIIFNFEQIWMGGITYILNILKTLDFLDDDKKPEVTLFYRADLKKYTEHVSYPYFQSIEWDFPDAFKGYIRSWSSGKNVFIEEIIHQYNLDGVYPLRDFPVKTNNEKRLISWYADLQHKYYPEFFTRRKRMERAFRIRFMLKNSYDLVVSSQTVADDFLKFYKIRSSLNIHIFQFVSVIEDFGDLKIEDLRTKYQLPEKYFLVANQFHRHKNHNVLMRALVKLKERNKSVHLVTTGRFPKATHSAYMQELHTIINDHDLHSHISLLGLIPRDEQLFLMKHAQAVLQPSLFEGWSTVIEDAKSLQAPVVASNIPVNVEQLGPDGKYFDPNDAEELAQILTDYPERNLDDIFYMEYNERIKYAANAFMKLFQGV